MKFIDGCGNGARGHAELVARSVRRGGGRGGRGGGGRDRAPITCQRLSDTVQPTDVATFGTITAAVMSSVNSR